jgi:hypothetical protein
VWEHDGDDKGIQLNRFGPGMGWQGAEPVVATTTDDAGGPVVGLDEDENAVVAWLRLIDGVPEVWSSACAFGASCGAAVGLETRDGEIGAPRLVVDVAGNALALWDRDGGHRLDLWARRYVVGVGWSAAELVECSDVGSTQLHDLALDAAGNAIAIWTTDDYAGDRRVHAAHHTPSSGWSEALALDVDVGSAIIEPRVAMNPAGEAIAVWGHAENSGRTSVRSRRLP